MVTNFAIVGLTAFGGISIPELSPMLHSAGPVQARVESVVLGVQLAHVVVRITDDHLVETFITRARAEELKLQIGKSVTTQITDSEVVFQ
jgi:molybdopterin-binding protein